MSCQRAAAHENDLSIKNTKYNTQIQNQKPKKQKNINDSHNVFSWVVNGCQRKYKEIQSIKYKSTKTKKVQKIQKIYFRISKNTKQPKIQNIEISKY